MGVKPATEKWQVVWVGNDSYHAYRKVEEDGAERIQSVTVAAHCKWCAKLQLVKEHGGRVDLRGSYGECAARLKEFLATQE